MNDAIYRFTVEVTVESVNESDAEMTLNLALGFDDHVLAYEVVSVEGPIDDDEGGV